MRRRTRLRSMRPSSPRARFARSCWCGTVKPSSSAVWRTDSESELKAACLFSRAFRCWAGSSAAPAGAPPRPSSSCFSRHASCGTTTTRTALRSPCWTKRRRARMTSSSHHATVAANVVGSLLLGDSRAIQRLRSLIARLATSNAPVLIQGPTGSGKELVAEALHLCSGRPGPFVPFNVCAISDGTFESQLFGHVRGAFTGAVQDTRGYLAEADRGTVFFDEICSLTLNAQAKLLRAIETRSFRPVGGRHDRTSDFRLVAGSNEDLAALVGEGRFRLDLYHRLRALLVRVPPLVDHLEDVPLLARHFARCAADGGTTQLTDAAIACLMEHRWPGNVRELRNVVEFAIALADGPIVDSL